MVQVYANREKLSEISLSVSATAEWRNELGLSHQDSVKLQVGKSSYLRRRKDPVTFI